MIESHQHKFVKNIAISYPISYAEVNKCFGIFLETVEGFGMEEVDIKKGFTSLVVLSLSSGYSLERTVSDAVVLLQKKPTWLQKLRWWFIGFKRKVRCFFGLHDYKVSKFQVISTPELDYECKYCGKPS